MSPTSGSPAPGQGGASKPKDGRQVKRARRRLMVRFGVNTPERSAFSQNISESGIFIHTNHIFRPGTTLAIQVQFPDRSFSFWGRVIWGKKVPSELAHLLSCGMGVCFIDPSPEWLEYYERFKKKAGLF